MTFEIGHLTFQPTAPPPQRLAPPEPVASAPPAGGVDSSDLIPASPPPELLAEVDAAWARADELAAEDRQLHFRRDELSGRTIIEVRTLAGELLRTIPPSKALNVIAGEAL